MCVASSTWTTCLVGLLVALFVSSRFNAVLSLLAGEGTPEQEDFEGKKK